MRHECAAVSGEGRHVGRRRAADFLVRRIPIRCRTAVPGARPPSGATLRNETQTTKRTKLSLYLLRLRQDSHPVFVDDLDAELRHVY